MTSPKPQRARQWSFVLLISLYVALAAGYFVLRYAGQWSDSDTANLTRATAGILDAGRLQNSEDVYGLGFAYQSLSAFVETTTGLSLSQLQLYIFPIVAGGLSILAFVMYRALTGNAAAAALATLILFMQPDFLFVIFRGSHEKVTWLAAGLAIFMLAKSLHPKTRSSHVVAFVGLFYLATFALIASNAFFGSSFIIAVTVSLVAGFLILRLTKPRHEYQAARKAISRLTYVTSSAIVIWFLSAFYLYRPAIQLLYTLRQATDQAATVALGHEPSLNPYAAIGWGWTSQSAYAGLILPTLLTGFVSFIVWLMLARQLFKHKTLIQTPSRFLLWLLYGGFGLQFALGILLDRLGSVGGNLQLRFFPVMLLMGSGLTAILITRLWRRQQSTVASRGLALILGLMILWASTASLLKATNDPWFSNYWKFWTKPEDRAVQWAEEHLQYRSVWLGLDGIRVSSHATARGFGTETGNVSDTWVKEVETRHILVSEIDQELSVRRLTPLPNVRGENRVYDNGTVTEYHLRPRTPYQR